jgi:hypothetical protein
MGRLRSWWAGRAQLRADKRALHEVVMGGYEQLAGWSPRQLRELKAQADRAAQRSHGLNRESAQAISRLAERSAQDQATAKARHAAQRDRQDMQRRERALAEGKLPVTKVGIMRQEGGRYVMEGWEFEDTTNRVLQPGQDAIAATGWSAPELLKMSQDQMLKDLEARFFGSQAEAEAGG